jgi:hypothetical protein
LFFSSRRAFRAPALLVALALGAHANPAAAGGPQVATVNAGTTATTQLDGRVVDAQSGLPLPGATIVISGIGGSILTDTDGRFHLPGLPAGIYVVRVAHDGYQTADAPNVVVTGPQTNLTLALVAAPTGTALATIGRTSSSAGGALQTASTINRFVSPEELTQTGVFRAGDALRALPDITNGITGDTAALSDDIQLSFRGIGTLESLAEIDGHPIGYGVPGGYNYQIAPLTPLRSVLVTYGSGDNYSGFSAIGGTVNFETLDPTPDERISLSQGIGTFSKADSTVRATGTLGRLGYAFAYGVDSLDGPINNNNFYQPSAAYDQSTILSAANPAVRALGFYKDDSLAVDRSGLLKLRYALSPISALTLTGLADWKWVDKTGNGDGDYLGYAPALATGEQLLASYAPADFPTLPVCPKGTFVATNANGKPNGFGPNGQPDGGLTCQTPQQYATFNTGFQGVGPRWQSFAVDDYHLGYELAPAGADVKLDAFTNRYNNFQDRLGQLPYDTVPGDTSANTLNDTNVAEAGATFNATLFRAANDVGFGLKYLNTAYAIAKAYPTKYTLGAPVVHESGFLLRDVYHPTSSPLTAYLTANFDRASATDSSYVDPRAALVYRASSRDIVRVAAGATTTQPAGNELYQPFTASAPGGGGGAAPINCGSLNSIGSAPSVALHPERGVDEDLAYGHKFDSDSNVQLTLYNVNIYNKLYSTIAPLSETGTSFIDPAYLESVEAAVAAKCGVPDAASLLGLKGNVNVGQLRARGVLLGGRQRIVRDTFFDYDVALDSTVLVSVPTAYLKSNLNIIPGSQLPNLPLQTGEFALDHRFGHGLEARYSVNLFSANNSKNLPAYNVSRLRVDIPGGAGRFTLTIDNLFNQYGNIEGLIGQGVPLALNGYAGAAAYAPYIGASATEQFGLPPRSLYLNFSLATR